MNTFLQQKIKQEMNKTEIKNKLKVILIIYNIIFIISNRVLKIRIIKI